MTEELKHPFLLSFQVGVTLATNAIRDAYLVVDGPNCVLFRTSQVQGNHDWQSDLLRSDGLHRIADTDCTTERAAVGDDRLLNARLIEVNSLSDCGLILLSSLSPVAITGRQYDQVVDRLSDQIEKPVVVIPCGSLVGDWLDGYKRTLEALAGQLPLDVPEKLDPKRVAVVGLLMDRNEADRNSDVEELARLLEGLGLELATCWLGGGDAAGLAQVGSAGTILSLPYGRKAARILADRTGAKLVEGQLPIGLEGTCRWLRAVGETLSKQKEAEAFIESELKRVVPPMEWILPHALVGKTIGIIADPHLGRALQQAVVEFGCRVTLRIWWAADHHLEEGEAEGDGPLLVNPQSRMVGRALNEALHAGRLDLVLTNSQAETQFPGPLPKPLGLVEIGFPSYHHHALHPRPCLGFQGCLVLVERLANALGAQAVQTRLHSRGSPSEEDPAW